MTDSFHRSLDAALAREPLSYDRLVADEDPFPLFAARFIVGIDPAELDEDVVMTLAGGDIFPITVETRVTVLEDDVAELFWGGNLIPLCDRRPPAKGQE